MDSPSLNLRLSAEALGTFLLFLGFNAVAVASDLGEISTLGVAFVFGLGLTLAITALGHLSGGHFNPALRRDGVVGTTQIPVSARLLRSPKKEESHGNGHTPIASPGGG